MRELLEHIDHTIRMRPRRTLTVAYDLVAHILAAQAVAAMAAGVHQGAGSAHPDNARTRSSTGIARPVTRWQGRREGYEPRPATSSARPPSSRRPLGQCRAMFEPLADSRSPQPSAPRRQSIRPRARRPTARRNRRRCGECLPHPPQTSRTSAESERPRRARRRGQKVRRDAGWRGASRAAQGAAAIVKPPF